MFWRAAHSALAPRAHLERYSSGTHRYSSVLETSQTPWGERIWSDPHPVLIGTQSIANSMGRAHLERYSSGTHRYSSVLETSQTPWGERIWSDPHPVLIGTQSIANSMGRAHLERYSSGTHRYSSVLKTSQTPWEERIWSGTRRYSKCRKLQGESASGAALIAWSQKSAESKEDPISATKVSCQTIQRMH